MSISLNHISQLIQDHIDGRLSPEEIVRLNACLRADPDVRDLYLEMADAHSCLAADERLWVAPRASESSSIEYKTQPHGVLWHPFVAAVVGIVLGMFCTSMVFAYVAPSLNRIKTIFAEGFETGPFHTVPGIPRQLGIWSGDEAETVTETQGVRPLMGRQMLRFISATHPNENSPRSQWGDVYRVVDLAGMTSAPNLRARISASFACGTNSESNTFSAFVEAILIDHELDELPVNVGLPELQQRGCATASRRLPLSESPGAWREVSIEVPLTRAARYLILHLAVQQNHPILTEGAVIFPHHYVDDVKISVLHRP